MHVALDETGMDRRALRVDDPFCRVFRCDGLAVSHRNDAPMVYGNRTVFKDAIGIVHRYDIAVSDDQIDPRRLPIVLASLAQESVLFKAARGATTFKFTLAPTWHGGRAPWRE